jgi:CubicO group peptidase (beta-lactamase class C family)
MRRTLPGLIAAALVTLSVSLSAQSADFITARFQSYLDALRRQTGIPGLSGVVLRNGSVVWEAGLGVQNIERNLPATPDTPYYLGDLSQTFTATMVLQCIEQGLVSFDDVVVIPQPTPQAEGVPPVTASIRQLLIHDGTTPGGPWFEYNPGRFAALSTVVERCGQVSYQQHVATTLLDRLGMSRSLPGLDAGALEPTPFDAVRIASYTGLAQDVATPYRVEGGNATVSAIPPGVNGAVGMISTVRDMARLDAALDQLVLLRHDTLVNAWTPRSPVDGRLRPFGHGWFAQMDQNEPIVWHFGYTPGVGSALWLKLPTRGMTLILLANSDGLSAQFPLKDGDINSSPFARLFFSIFR